MHMIEDKEVEKQNETEVCRKSCVRDRIEGQAERVVLLLCFCRREFYCLVYSTVRRTVRWKLSGFNSRGVVPSNYFGQISSGDVFISVLCCPLKHKDYLRLVRGNSGLSTLDIKNIRTVRYRYGKTCMVPYWYGTITYRYGTEHDKARI